MNVATKESAESGKTIDRILKKQVPALLVSDPSVEANDLAETNRIIAFISEEKGEQAVLAVTNAIAARMQSFSMHIRSFMDAILAESRII